MRVFLFLVLCLPCLGAFAQVERTALYDCAFMGDGNYVEGLTIFESLKGRRHFYEVEVRAYVAGEYRESVRQVNLVSTYGGRVQTYGTGNFRVQVNRVLAQNGKFRAFARIPEYDMHSQEWTCKDAR